MAEAKKAVKPSVKAKANAYWATGRRKKAIARVRLVPNGKGTITINKKDIDEYFDHETLKYIVRQPLELTENQTKFDIFVNVDGGGYTGQAGAIRLGIARALVLSEENLKPELRLFNKRLQNERKKEIWS